ncbi:hypothetical protein MITS9509_01803 [Synechococcus sp. MIT S9509]|uniref:hypothetical protein n=1 Tax=Synechococcus sp. MIT S9509 TaxID=1801630 RepID=UPI0007BB1F46|nr:hypothetical protein [Synechococcus sp. MIT S9509]KZR91882.1 hypothetical protein MITS9509_01803 [Synechococcus sp. MIT S9509]
MKPYNSRDQAVSYWLMPCPQGQQRFEDLTRQALSSLHGCTLDTHITLYSDHLDDEESSRDRLGQVAESRKPILLYPSAIEAGPLFTTSLIVRFEASGELNSLFTQLHELSPQQLGYRLNPHLSLLYSTEAAHSRQNMAEMLTLPAPALFNRVRAVVHPLTVRTAEDIAAFTTLGEFTLA